MIRGAALGLVAAGALLWLATSLVSPFPTSPYALADDVEAAGTLNSERVRLAVAFAAAHSYDAESDTTLYSVAYCNHSLCGPLVRLAGSAARIEGPLLLDPIDPTLSFVDAPPADGPLPHGPPREDEGAYSSWFALRSPHPPFLARLAALALGASGIALALRPHPSSAAPGILGAAVGLLVARGPSLIILAQLGFVPLIAIAGVVALVGRARKGGWGAAAVAFFGAVALLASFLAFFHFPPSGAGD